MLHPVISAVVPVVLLISVGVLAGRLRLIGAGALKDLSNIVVLVLMPALLFRTMSGVRPDRIVLAPLVAYFLSAFVIFFGVLAVRGFNREAALLGLAATFGNTTAIGVPLVSLAYGETGLVQLFPLISVHALLLLTFATLVLELAVAREQRAAGAPGHRSIARAILVAIRNAVIHPVPLPIFAGIAFGLSGWTLPAFVDKPLEMLGQAFGPMALVMVGATLAQVQVGAVWGRALGLAALKNMVHPLLVLGAGSLLGLSGVPFAVMVLAACLPIGNYVFLFSQRYDVGRDVVAAAVAVSTLLAMVSISIVLAVFARA